MSRGERLEELLEAEVDELLGRRQLAWRQAVDAASGYRSGPASRDRLCLCGAPLEMACLRAQWHAERQAWTIWSLMDLDMVSTCE